MSVANYILFHSASLVELMHASWDNKHVMGFLEFILSILTSVTSEVTGAVLAAIVTVYLTLKLEAQKSGILTSTQPALVLSGIKKIV